jgi:Domain of unknown function (DUF4382)
MRFASDSQQSFSFKGALIMLYRKVRTLVTASALSALAVACGGGGSSSSATSGGSSSTTTNQGVANVAITDAPGDFDNVYVTVSAVWFHTSNTAGPDDPGWLKYSLPTPMTVDLLTLQNGNLAQIFSSVALPNGNYQQMRLILVATSTTPLQASIAGLTYNDQVNYQDSSDTEQSAPLELVNPDKGIALYGTFTINGSNALDLALDFNVDRDVLKFYVGNQQDFILKPRLAYFNLSHVGAITGSVNCADLLANGGTGFAYDVVIKAEMLSSDGTYHVVDRETGLHLDLASNSCTFTLFPLHIPSGSTSANFDVMIRGRNMDTIIVQGVPVQVGTDAATGTALSIDPLTLTQGTEYTANMPANMPVSPTGADVQFYQTLPSTSMAGSTEPYEIRYQGVNPFTGTFTDNEPLSLGPVQQGIYVANADPSLAPVAPNQGLGGFDPYGSAAYFTRTEATTGTLTPPSGGAVGSFTISALQIASPADADSISGTLTQSTAGKYDAGYVIISHDGYIVTTLPLGAVLAQNGGTGGPYSIANIPGGSSTQNFAPGLYYLHAFVWNSADPFLSLHRVEGAGVVDLRGGSATGVDLTLH